MQKNLIFCLFSFVSTYQFAQLKEGTFTGNIESTFQYLNKDSVIGANQPDSKGLLNTYMNLFYTNGHIKAGLRVESYLPRIQGYPNRFDGTGIGMRYIGYENDFVDVTLGSFYEQFGSGLALRAYEDRALGYDNMLDGVRLKVKPAKGVVLKGVYGYQRLSFQGGRIIHGEGIVRGIDGESHIKELFKSLADKNLDITIGGSFVSKYQKDDNDLLILPQNTATYGGRAKLAYKGFTLEGEYMLKGQDPSLDNQFIYNRGQAALINLGYTRKGLGILLSAKSVDNMSYRSDRNKDLQDVFINYLPALNKTHSYNLVASLYPYATQPTGEVAFQGEVLYTFKKGSKLGGKYGMSINVNYSSTFAPIHHTAGINPLDSTGVTYEGRLFDKSNNLYWQDINANITRKFNKKFSMIVSYFNISLNNDVAKISNDAKGIINANIGVIELGYKFNPKNSMRVELQGLVTAKGPGRDKGDWATLVVEYNISPNWFFSVMEQYNYGNPVKANRTHYPIASVGYIREAARFTVSYGRQRAGLFCVGGVCRFVPASNGLTFSYTQSF